MTASPARGWRQTSEGREPLDARMQQIVFQIRAGRPFKAIAEQFGVSVQRISKIRRDAGIARRVEPAESI